MALNPKISGVNVAYPENYQHLRCLTGKRRGFKSVELKKNRRKPRWTVEIAALNSVEQKKQRR